MVRFWPHNTLLSLFFPFVIICNMTILSHELKAVCNKNDRQILLNFKHGLTDPSNMLSTWSSKEDCCEWSGVHCDNITGRVTNLSLPCSTEDSIVYGNKEDKTHCLAGEFHTSLFQLEYLNFLNLSNNNFQTINLSHGCRGNSTSSLVYLDLSRNRILMIDHMRWLLPLSSLEYLNLDLVDLHNQTSWSQILTMLPSLFELSLSGCFLKSITAPSPFDYANFTSLGYLDLSHNDFFTEIPNWLFNLSGLHSLNLEESHFYGQIPNTLLNLQNLNYLRLRKNRLTGIIPDWIGQLGGSLGHLYLSWNLFTGSIPTSVANLSSLTKFSVSSNCLTGNFPESLGQLSNLKVLSIEGNPLSGNVSHKNFAKLSKLETLLLGSPSFIFDFDPYWIPPFQLKDLTFEYVDVKSIQWLYTQKYLKNLEIKHSKFPSTIDQSPEKFWSWTTNLRYLDLFNNSMHWDMSSVLLNSEIIWLAENGLRGGLPRLTSNVKFFGIAHNYLAGSLSPLLCNKMNGETNNLQYLDVSFNLLTGGLTNCWVNWKSLQLVNLGSNNLTGMIPYSMGTLSNLLFLQVYDNKMYGEIPMSLKNCQKLLFLNLGGNKFSGCIPSWMGQNVKVVQLRSNEFSGDIPLQICHLSSLIVLDLANNRLSGTIPHCLNNITAMILDNALESVKVGVRNASSGISFRFFVPLMTKGITNFYGNVMRVVDLSGNHLSGEMPLQIFKLTALQSMNLSNNQLTGIIPQEIGNVKQLESLDFSNNKLSGKIPQNLSALSFLEALNLSFNNLMGQIPFGTQLQSFTALSYEGNPELCGNPLVKKCTNDKVQVMENSEKNELLEEFYMGMGIGFAISFWVVCGSIFFVRRVRHAYFKFLSDVKDRLYVKIVLNCTHSVET